jgi:predicted RecB family nuclease
MATKITRDIIESYLSCKYKGHLKLAGQQGNRSDYELLLAQSRDAAGQRAIDKIIARHSEEEVERGLVLTPAVLKRGAAFFVNVTLEDECVSLAFDGLQRVPGSSKLGDFHYVPVLFCGGREVHKQQRTLLDVYGFFLSRLQGRTPGSGIIWHGQECRATQVRLNPDPRKTERLLEELCQIQIAPASPRLVLNDHCAVCEFRQQCHEQAVQEDNISLLRGMKEKEVKAYARKGILTVAQLSHTFRPRRPGKRPSHKPQRHYHALQAMAVRDSKVYVFGTPQLRASPVRLHLDIEGDPEEGYIYLIGLVVVQDESETHHSFWADSKEQELQIFEQFLAEVSRYENFLVFCYGGYERAFLKRMKNVAKCKEAVDRVLDAVVNTLSLVYAHVYFPCYSNGLKDVGSYLGCHWTEPNASGLQSIVWRKRWEAAKGEEWKRKLTTYNLEDCVALAKVTTFLYALQRTATPSSSQGEEDNEVPQVTWADDLKPPSTRRTWCKATFFFPQFGEINECAYFDYQRDKVFVRTNPALARASRRQKKSRRARRLRVNDHVELTVDECPHCQSKDLVPSEHKDRRKMLFDLKFSPGGIRRRIVECVAPYYVCSGCGRLLFSEKFPHVAKHQHALKSWVVFEHVAHRVSFKKIGATLEDYFGLHVNTLFLLKFKDLMARHYQPACDAILKRMITGDLIHADETKVELKGEEGYVWVLTNLEEVVFLYKPTREGGFLHEMLRDFKGVLVSDFFSAYDSLPCPQQKCLIHLIRDLNHDLFQSPYDEELKSLASCFGELLRRIIRTVDQHGLRRKYLSRHNGLVDHFFSDLTAACYASEVTQGYQVRFLKNREKLFTFLNHDGVPWNNNNAEHAIKQFAFYRQTCEGHITAAGLQEYLVLLSIQQTCKYKGVSFLKFLLSRELDIDRFCQGAGKRSGPLPLDVYPKGFSFRRFGARKRYGD